MDALLQLVTLDFSLFHTLLSAVPIFEPLPMQHPNPGIVTPVFSKDLVLLQYDITCFI